MWGMATGGCLGLVRRQGSTVEHRHRRGGGVSGGDRWEWLLSAPRRPASAGHIGGGGHVTVGHSHAPENWAWEPGWLKINPKACLRSACGRHNSLAHQLTMFAYNLLVYSQFKKDGAAPW